MGNMLFSWFAHMLAWAGAYWPWLAACAVVAFVVLAVAEDRSS